MASEIGTAYVRVRPNVSGFKSETESGVRSAFGGIARIVGPLLTGAAAFKFGKDAVSAAAEESSALATVRRSVLDTDKAWRQHGSNVGAILTKEARDAGFNLGDVAKSFGRLETGTQNTARSLKDLHIAEDVARGRHVDLALAATALAKAEQGSTTSLQRLGVVIPPVTSHVAKLKIEHGHLAEAGVKFDATAKEQYKSSLANALALDKQATKTKVLAEVQNRFRGQTKTFAEGPAGEFARLRENISQFEASIGRDLLPTINVGVEDFRRWVDELRTSDSVHRAVASGVHLFAQAVQTGKSAVEFFIPPLRTVASVLSTVGHFAGVGGVLAFAGGFKAVKLAVEGAAAVQGRYQQILAAGSTAEAGRAAVITREAGAYNLLTGSVERNAIALDANAISQAGGAASIERSLLPEAAQVSQVLVGVEDSSRAASEGIATFGQETANAASAAGDSALSTADAISSVSDHSLALAKDGATAARSVSVLGNGLGVAAAGSRTFAAGLTVAQAAQLAQAGVTTEQIAALDRYLIATQSTLSAQRAQAIATEGQSFALAENVAALNADTEALIANRVANLAAAEASVIGAGVQTASSIERTATAAGGLGTTLSRVGRGLFALSGGMKTVVGVGIAAFAFGLYKGFTAETGLEQASHRLGDALKELGGNLNISAGLARTYAQSISNIKSDKVAIDVAKANVALAKQALATSDAKRGSAEYLSLTTQLESAQDGLRRAEEGLSSERRTAAGLAVKRRENEDAIAASVDKSIARVEELRRAAGTRHEGEASPAEIAGLRARLGISAEQARVQAGLNRGSKDFSQNLAAEAGRTDNAGLRTRLLLLKGLTDSLGKVPSRKEVSIVLHENVRPALNQIIATLVRAKPSAEGFAAALRQERFSIQASNPALARRIGLLIEFTRQVGRVPTKREVNIALKTGKLNEAITAMAGILRNMQGRAQAAGFNSGAGFASNFIRALLGSGVIGALNSLLTGASAIGAAVGASVSDVPKRKLSSAQTDVDNTNKSIAAVNRSIKENQKSISGAGNSVADANNGLANAIRDGAQQVRDAVQEANRNLFSIGQQLSDTIGQFLDETNTNVNRAAAVNTKSAEFKRLKAIVAGGGPDAARAAQELQSQIDQGDIVAAQKGDDQKKRTARQINDLVDLFNKGAITIATFNRRLSAILASDGISYKKAGAVLGIAFADGFRAQVRGLRVQAGAIAAGPRFRGETGLEPDITRPLDAVKASQEAIAQAQKARDDASLGVAKSEKGLQAKIEERQRLLAQRALEQTHLQRLMEQHLRFLKNKKDAVKVTIEATSEHSFRPKPPGAASKKARDGQNTKT